jgi:signal transduction histidine kinase/ligand-binding sensor domain-containing protein/DNA-binding response OmpR family regulator
LQNNSVLTVFEDSRTNFWIGTTGGLQRFDPKTEQFITIRFEYPNITDFSYVSCIIEDRKGNIWLSTGHSGIICLEADKGYRPVFYMTANCNICSDNINIIFEDRFGNIWAGSLDNGVSTLNVDNHTLLNYTHDPRNRYSLSSNRVFSIVETPEGNILVGTIGGGIDLFDLSSKKFIRNYIPSPDAVFTMKNGSKNNLWIGTEGFGLKSYDYNTKIISDYDTEYDGINMKNTKVHSIFEDRKGNLWIALYQKGILMMPQEGTLFHSIGFNPFYPERNIGTECVLCIMEDSRGKVWIGTDGDGIYRLNSQRKVDWHYSMERPTIRVVLSLFEDSRKRIWAGTYLDGLFLYDASAASFRKEPLFSGGKEIKHINVIEEDREGNLWIGANENGLCCYNPDTKKMRNFTFNHLKNNNQLLSNSIHTIHFSKNSDVVWIGTSNAGLSRYHLKTGVFDHFSLENGKLNNNNIYAVAEDKSGNLWIGTKQGLHFLDMKRDTTFLFTETDGLANASVCGIEIDRYDNLWISTSLGLSHYNTHTNVFSNYYSSNGLHNDEFRKGAHFRAASGELFFGGIEGLTSFYPFTSETSRPLSNLVFTGLYFYNEGEAVEAGKANHAGLLPQNIHTGKEISISYRIRNFSLGFVALEYNSPDKVIYQVKMENFDEEWKTLPPGARQTTYTNLKHGSYTFKVRAFLPDTQPLERSISIIIKPPFWLSGWAKGLYILSLLASACIVFLQIKKRMQLHEQKVRQENENHIMQSKLQFFTDISHEIRTPLTLILSPVEKLIKETPDSPLRNTYKLINQNGQRILRLVNQVMEMRELDRGQVKLSASQTDVCAFLREIAAAFEAIAEEKDITFTLHFAENLPAVAIDREKLDKVIFNVLSNAFKYTPPSGQISITADTTPDDLRIRIADTGEGIPEEFRELVFDRFYQTPSETNRNKLGTGIGLHLSRNLMKIHHGKIHIENTTKQGCTFVILLPLRSDYLKPEEMTEAPAERNLAMLLQPSLADLTIEQETNVPDQHANLWKYKLLIVENDVHIRQYITNLLKSEYCILEAGDGQRGLELAISEMPDCVITDMMMPGMSGTEMCKKIKDNEKTCHIPVIILTAKTAIEQRVEGLEVGADSYIPKPFNIDHLKVRIRKLIELRRTIREKYEGKHETRKETIRIKSDSEKFLEKLEEIVNRQMHDSELSVETVSRQLGVSRSQLQRRLKQLTNQNPSDYLRAARLQYAALLLTSKNLSISEITYATGFTSLSHFSNSFKEFFGMSPSHYVEISKGNIPVDSEE